MNFKNRAYAVLAMVVLYNILAYSMWGDEFRMRDLQNIQWMLGFAMGWTGFGMIYRLGGFFASSFSRYQGVAFGLWLGAVVLDVLRLPGGFVLIAIAYTLLLVQYIRFFMEIPKKETREILYLVTIVMLSGMMSLYLAHLIPILLLMCVVSWLLALVALEYLYSQWKNPDGPIDQDPTGNADSNLGDSGNPFDKPL